MEEVWEDIKGYEGLYKISNLGRVKSLERWIYNVNRKYLSKEKILKPIKVGNYLGVQLSFKGKSEKFYIHRLVCEHFIIKIDGKTNVNHIDGNKENNVVDNLEWCNQSENNYHAFNNGLINSVGEKHHYAIYSDDEVKELRKLYKTGKYKQSELANMFGMSKMTVHRIVKNKLRKRMSTNEKIR